MEPELTRAWEQLGVGPGADAEAVRRAYRDRLFQHHPDTSGSDGTTVRSLIEAYRLVSGHVPPVEPGPLVDPDGAPVPGQVADAVTDVVREGDVWLVDSDTIALACPAEDAYLRLLEVAHLIGDVTYVDRSCGLMEALLRTRDGTTLSLVVTLQGRATGHTDAFLTVEPLDVVRGPLPAIADLTELVASYLRR